MIKINIQKGKYFYDDYFVTAINASEYITNTDDVTDELQKAIDDCRANGGGVVYLPEGVYNLRKQLKIKTSVTLHGEWVSPDDKENLGKGTIINCFYGKESDDPQILMEACTGFTDMTVFYPEQDINAPIPYSPTIRQNGVDSVTVQNVTLVNPWIGFWCGPDGNELHFLNNVCMTPLHIGVYMDMTTDIGRLQSLNIAPKYYEIFCNLNENSSSVLRAHMLKETTGVFMARSDWEYIYNIYIENCKTGFVITSMKSGGPNTQIMQLNIFNCDVGFNLINVNPYGVALSDSTIGGDIKGLTAAIVTDERFKTLMQLNAVDICGSFKNFVVHNGSGQLSFVDCSFKSKNDEMTEIQQNTGGLSLINCRFVKGEGISGDVTVNMPDTIGGTQIIGCTVMPETSKLVINGSKDVMKKLQLDNDTNSLTLPAMPRGGHKKYPFKTYPESFKLYVVTDFGGIADGKTDNTAPFQAALDEAAATGGIVYVPGGWYRFDGSITVPKNVELRGAFHVPCHTMGGGSVLQPFGGKGSEDGDPFIIMEEYSGVKGIVIHHPEQNPVEPVKYPWAIQARGRRCYVMNTVFVNSWLGLDLGTYGSPMHYVSYISGAPIKCGVFVGNNAEEGWIENIQYNPHYWFRSDLPNRPTRQDWKFFWHNQIKYLNALQFGYNESVHLLGTFVFAALNGLHFILQDGKGSKGKFIGHGTDGGEKGLRIDGVDDVDLINTELVTIESPKTRIYIYVSPDATGKARIFNTLMWGNPHYAVVADGGDVTLIQSNFQSQGEVGVTVNGGKFDLTCSYFYNNTANLQVNGGDVRAKGNMTVYDPDMNNCGIDSTIKNGKVDIDLNWVK